MSPFVEFPRHLLASLVNEELAFPKHYLLPVPPLLLEVVITAGYNLMFTLLWLYDFYSFELVYQDMLLFLDNFLFTLKLIISSFFPHSLSILDT